jgi:acetoin:2,6-dichlorophenolindophenol oxidoreductase subunit alpha
MTATTPTLDEDLYRRMRTIRRFEETVVELVNTNEIPGTTHEYIGQEAVAAGVSAALRPDDMVASTHRGHGHVIAKGADVGRMFAELMARETGLNHGRGGSMHVADLSLGVLGANGMVAGGTPFALGAAWGRRVDGRADVTVAYFGDGALGQGVLLECFNLAALWQLPVIFVCENNGYAVSLSVRDAVSGPISARADACDIPAVTVDGMDARAVHAAATAAIERARGGGGPSFIECLTYRYAGHHTAEASLKLTYRTPEEIAEWRAKDPLLVARGWLGDDAVDRIDAEVEAEIERGVAFARSSPPPDPATALDHMYASEIRPPRGKAG